MLNEGNIWGNPASTNSGVGWGQLYIQIVWSHIALKFPTLLIVCKVHDGTCHIQYMEHGSIQLEKKGQKTIIICRSTQLNTRFSYVKILGHIHLRSWNWKKHPSDPRTHREFPSNFIESLRFNMVKRRSRAAACQKKKQQQQQKHEKTGIKPIIKTILSLKSGWFVWNRDTPWHINPVPLAHLGRPRRWIEKKETKLFWLPSYFLEIIYRVLVLVTCL